MINHRERGFNTTHDFFVEFERVDKPLMKLFISRALFSEKCAIIGCLNANIGAQRIRVLKRARKSFTVESVRSKSKTLRERTKVESALGKKQIPLCEYHHVEWNRLEKTKIRKFYLNK
jgi:hypothetical protein